MNERTQPLKKLLSSFGGKVTEISRQEAIAIQALYAWRDHAKKVGIPVPGKLSTAEDWLVEMKLTVVPETTALTESEFSECCRKKGIYPE